MSRDGARGLGASRGLEGVPATGGRASGGKQAAEGAQQVAQAAQQVPEAAKQVPEAAQPVPEAAHAAMAARTPILGRDPTLGGDTTQGCVPLLSPVAVLGVLCSYCPEGSRPGKLEVAYLPLVPAQPHAASDPPR